MHLLDNLIRLRQQSWENLGAELKCIDNIKSKLNALSGEKYSGAVVRERSENFPCGEQPTKLALAAEKGYAMKTGVKDLPTWTNAYLH